MNDSRRREAKRRDEDAARLDFEIEVDDGRGRLLLRPRTFFGGLRVDRLELEIPNVSFPLDITGGVQSFKAQRCQVVAATFAVDERSLEHLLEVRAPLLEGAGFHEVRIRFLEGMAELSGRVTVAERSAEFTARAYVGVVKRGFRVILADFRLFGHVRRPAPLLAHDFLGLFLGATSVASQNEEDGGEGDAAVVTGLAEVEVRPLDLLLWRTFPAGGWRLPNADAARVIGWSVSPDRAEIRFGAVAEGLPRSPSTRAAAYLELAGRFHAADQVLGRGDLDGALAAYRAEVARRPAEAPFLAERLLDVLCARDSTMREAERVAAEAVARWPEFIPGHLVLARLAAFRERLGEAAAHFERALHHAEAAGDDEEAVHAALAVARSLRGSDAARAAAFYERVLERRPTQPEALNALGEQYAGEKRWHDLLRVLRRQLDGAAGSDAERAHLHLRLGEVILDQLADPARAREELERAVALDDELLAAWDLLARALGNLGEDEARLRALERLVKLHQAKRDVVGEARLHLHIAMTWERLGDDVRARESYEQVLAFRPYDLDVLEKTAAIDARAGRHDQALTVYQQILATTPSDPPDRLQRVKRAIGRLLVTMGEIERARHALGESGDDPDALLTLAALEEKVGQPRAAIAALARAEALLKGAEAAATAFHAAELHLTLDRHDEHRAALERAHRVAPQSPAGRRAAFLLARHAAERGDPSEARWLDVLLADPTQTERADLALRRAVLAQAAGEPDEARRRLDEAEQAGAPATSVRRLRADVLGALGDHQGRARLLETLMTETADEEERARFVMGAIQAWIKAGELESAEAVARGVEGDPTAVSLARRARAEVAWQARRWDEVVALYSAITSEEPEARDRVECSRRRGVGLARQGLIPYAIEAYREALSDEGGAGPPVAIAWRNLADLHQRIGDSRAAAEAFIACADDPRTQETPAARAELYVLAAEQWRRRVGDRDRAIAALEGALRLLPGYLQALDTLDAVYAETGEWERVIGVILRKLAASAGQPDRQATLLERLIELTGASGAPEPVREAYRRALEGDPNLRPALRWLATDALSMGDVATAVEYYAHLSNLPTETPDEVEERLGAMTTLAALLDSAGRIDDAERYLLSALEIAPPQRHAEIVVSLEDLYQRSERWANLAAVLEVRARGVSEPGAWAILVDRRVRALLAADDVVTAAEACREALARFPDDPHFLDLLRQTTPGDDEPRTRVANLLELAGAAEGLVEKTLYRLEAAELCRTRLDEPLRARELYREVLSASPACLLAVARRVPAAALARKLTGYAAARMEDPDERAEAHRFGALKAGETSDAAGLEEHLEGLRRLGATSVRDLVRLAVLLRRRTAFRESAEVLAEALTVHARDLASRGERFGEGGYKVLGELRTVTAAAGTPVELARGLEAAAAAVDDETAVAWLREAADHHRQLGERDAAAEALRRALERSADDDTLRIEFITALSAAGAYDGFAETELAGVADGDGQLVAHDDAAPLEVAREASSGRVRAPADPADSRRTRVAAGEIEVDWKLLSEEESLENALLSFVGGSPQASPSADPAVPRSELAELKAVGGDLDALRQRLESIVATDPSHVPSLRSLGELYAEEGNWSQAAWVLDQLSRLVPHVAERADLLFRLGQVYSDDLGDPERAEGALLKAIDLNPGHMPSLCRLIDYYVRTGNYQFAADLAGELDHPGRDLTRTPPDTLARAALAAAWGGHGERARRLADTLGLRGAETLAIVLVEAIGTPEQSPASLLQAARLLGGSPGPRLDAIRSALGARVTREPRAEWLAKNL